MRRLNLENAMFGFKKRKIEVRVVTRDICRLTMDEFRSDKDRVKAARNTINDPRVRILLDVLRNSSPANMVITVPDIYARAFQQARIEGYHQALNDFEALGSLEKPVVLPEPEFIDPRLEEELV